MNSYEQLSKWYFAGRIEKSRMRFGVVQCAIPTSDPDVWRDGLAMRASADGISFIYTGPWTAGCDHGCAHSPGARDGDLPSAYGRRNAGTGTHGAGDTSCDQSGPVINPLDLVFGRSTGGIWSADAVFAWLDDFECYGTLVEIGMAHALGKTIYIGHSPEISLKGELWFALKAATVIIPSSDPRGALMTSIKDFERRRNEIC